MRESEEEVEEAEDAERQKIFLFRSLFLSFSP